MDVIYQLTFFLALTLLAIVVTVFVFAPSLLGRALKVAASGERDKLTERRNNIAKEMQDLKIEIAKGEANGQIPTGLRRSLNKLEKIDKKFEKELSKIRKTPKSLTVKGGIVPSSALLLAALILSGVAWYLSNIQVFTWVVPILVWILAVLAIGSSIYRMYQSLRVIEGVALTSEETALVRDTEVFKRALEEVEEHKRPELQLAFPGNQPPFHMRANTEMSLALRLSLIKGDLAEHVSVHLLAPPGFGFPHSETYLLPPDHYYANYIGTQWQIETAVRGPTHEKTLSIKAPSKVGSFRIVYYLCCKGYESGLTEVELEVD